MTTEASTPKPTRTRRSAEQIAADYKERAQKAERKAKLENTPGLKKLRAALALLNEALVEAKGSAHDAKVAGLCDVTHNIVRNLEE